MTRLRLGASGAEKLCARPRRHQARVPGPSTSPLDVIGVAVEVTLQSIITCPHCGAESEEVMPTDACIYFYECKGCLKLLRPKTGDCCVFCSFGSVKCPPVQLEKDCCGTRGAHDV